MVRFGAGAGLAPLQRSVAGHAGRPGGLAHRRPVPVRRIASAAVGQFDRAALEELTGGHRREDEPGRVT